jgi:hypothetical protein
LSLAAGDNVMPLTPVEALPHGVYVLEACRPEDRKKIGTVLIVK